jgi:hypothetical protein
MLSCPSAAVCAAVRLWEQRETVAMARAELVTAQRIESAILLIRGQKVMLDRDLAMLSSVPNSDRAIEVNIAIMRGSYGCARCSSAHKDLARKLDDLERKLAEHDDKFAVVFEAIRQLIVSAS